MKERTISLKDISVAPRLVFVQHSLRAYGKIVGFWYIQSWVSLEHHVSHVCGDDLIITLKFVQNKPHVEKSDHMWSGTIIGQRIRSICILVAIGKCHDTFGLKFPNCLCTDIRNTESNVALVVGLLERVDPVLYLIPSIARCITNYYCLAQGNTPLYLLLITSFPSRKNSFLTELGFPSRR